MGRAFKPTRRAAALCLLACALPVAAQRKPAAPIASRLESFKVNQHGTQEELEPAASALLTPGDTIEYAATHRNVSGRRLLEVDFGIPVPPGTTYVEGSAQPEGPRRVQADGRSRDQMVWRIPRMEPGETVTLRLRVLVAPDPTLPALPTQPRRPELRRQ